MKYAKKIALAILGSVLVLAFVGLFLSCIRQNYNSELVYRYDDGWTVALNDNERQNVSLSKFAFPAVHNGDVIVLRNTVPAEADGGNTVRLLMYLSTVEARLNGEVIYRYGQDYAEAGRLVGSGYHFIPLPIECEGAELEIIIMPTEPAAFTNIPVIEVVPSDNVYTNFADTHILSLFVSFFLFMLGAVLTIISIFALCFNRTYLRLLLIGTFSLLMGVWSMCNSKILQIFSTDLATNTFVEYISLYLAPIPFILLIWQMRRETAAQWQKVLCMFVSGLLSLFAGITLVLQLVNLVHFPVTVTAFHVIGVICLICMALIGIKSRQQMDGPGKILMMGIVVMCVSIALDLLRFNVQKYIMPENERLSTSVIPMGTMIFIIMLLISYLLYLYEMIMTKAEKETLTKMAYHDALSGLFNRAKSVEEFSRLDRMTDDYAIISFDLNGLKSTNDNLGHTMGDLLLQAFGQILKDAFGDFAKVFRMGGDEFLVIVEEVQLSKVDEGIRRMQALEQQRSVDYPFSIDTSYGIAYKSECPEKSSEKVLQIADERMYEMKVRAHKQRR